MQVTSTQVVEKQSFSGLLHAVTQTITLERHNDSLKRIRLSEKSVLKMDYLFRDIKSAYSK